MRIPVSFLTKSLDKTEHKYYYYTANVPFPVSPFNKGGLRGFLPSVPYQLTNAGKM
jgi:hypothetical protein